MSPRQSTALSSLKVLDLTRVRAGPTCVRILADFGADVIKIEAPEGVDPNEGMSGSRDGYDMQNLHRNKRCMTLNMKHDAARQIFMRLVEKADVVVENYRPDVKERLRISYSDLASVNEGIILASISGYGQDGPYKLRGGFDQIAQGMGGLMSLTGAPGQGPMRAGIAVADSSAGIYAAVAVLIALRERESSGRGQWVHTSLLEAQIAMLDFQAASYLVDGIVPQQAGNDHPYVTPMGVFKAADGYFNIGVAGQGLWRQFCTAVGQRGLIDSPRFKSEAERLTNRAELNALLGELFKSEPVKHWLALLDGAGVPAGPIYNVGEMFADPQVQHLAMTPSVKHNTRGNLSLVRQPITLSRTPQAMHRALPERGADTVDILQNLGFDVATITALRRDGTI